MKNQIVLVGLLLLAVLTSCGPSKKLKSAEAEANALRDRNSQLQRDTEVLRSQVASLASDNASLKKEYASYKNTCEETQESLKEVQNIIDEEQNTMQLVEQRLDAALEDFNKEGVDVYYRKGLLHVSLPDELLYKSGSSKLGKEGKEALGSLAAVLNEYPKLKVIVLGNTDNVLYKNGSDNWSLSTERANGVVRILRDQYKVDPSRLTSAGKGKYNPVADNNTPEGRAKNRRTDIILNPDIERIWDTARNDLKKNNNN